MHKLLYGDDIAIDNQTLFYDLDMGDALRHTRVRKIMDDIQIPSSDLDSIRHMKISNTAIIDDHDQHILTSDLCHILTICDKLAWHNVIDEILARRVILPNSHASLIINHSLSNNALIELYAKTNAYNLLYSHIHHDVPRITPNHDTIRDATLNGLRIASMNIYNGSMNDHNIKNCTSLTELNIYHDGCDITTCAPFAKSLRVLYPSCKMRNEGMRLCTSIVKLIACNNSIITTCKPFANSLEELDASRKCGIGDKGLASCHFIKKLSAWDNIKITTCKPFAKTLTNLNAGFNCGITDVGIASCNFIAEFSAVNNPKITTCVPFAKSLKRLTAGMSCGINNNSIASCHSLEYLHALYNPRITTRIRFTNSIKYLYVSYDEPATNAEALLFSRYISS